MVKWGLQQDEALAAVKLINKQACRIKIIRKSFYLISPELYRDDTEWKFNAFAVVSK